MRSCVSSGSLRLLHFPLSANHLLSYHPVLPPAHQLHLPRCGGQILCALSLIRTLAPLPSTTLSQCSMISTIVSKFLSAQGVLFRKPVRMRVASLATASIASALALPLSRRTECRQASERQELDFACTAPHPIPEGMLSRSIGNAKPQQWGANSLRHTRCIGKRFWKSNGIFFSTLPARVEPMEFSHFSEHTSPHVMSESQTPVQDERENSVIPSEGRFSKNYGADQKTTADFGSSF